MPQATEQTIVRVTTKDFFEASYGILMGRTKGPKLLPFLNALDKQFVVGRFKGVH